MTVFKYFIIFVFANLVQDGQSKIMCKSENNTDLDWYIVVKYPNSFNFFYLSSESNGKTWILPNYGLDSDKNLVSLTLNQAYNAKKDNSFYAFYNDKKSKISSSSKGHLKGVVNFDKDTGYWLVHSVPKYPSTKSYVYPVPQHINGQSFLCVSLKTSNLNTIATQLLIMYASVYSHNLPDSFSNDPVLESNLINLVNNLHHPGEKMRIFNMTTINNVPLIHFGKSKDFNKDLYTDLIAPGLKTTLYTETWMNGAGGKLPSNCNSTYKVYNIEKVKINNMEFLETADHSKWAVTDMKTIPGTCIGDINRMDSQFDRGGGSLCIFQPNIWAAFHDAVDVYEKCK